MGDAGERDELAEALAEAVRAIARELQTPQAAPSPSPAIGDITWLDDVADVLTIDDVAAVLRVGRNAAYQLVQTGELFAMRVGRSLRVPKPALVAYMGGMDWQETVQRHINQTLERRSRELR